MITNRDIQTAELFDRALAEVIESAQENGVENADLAEALRAHAAELDPSSDR
jgi:hypothetical protein